MFPAPQVQRAGERGSTNRVVLWDEDTGLVIDGRDEHLRACVVGAWRADPAARAEEIAAEGWRVFSATTDLIRPARDGRRPWTEADALRKARSTLRAAERGALKRIRKARLRPHTTSPGDLPDETRDAFNTFVLALHRRGALNRTEWRVSDLMAGRLVGGQCVDAVRWLAQELRIGPRAVERARRKLLVAEVWGTARQRGTRDQTAPYFPHPSILAQITQQTQENEGGVSSVTPNLSGVDASEPGAPETVSMAPEALPPDVVQADLFMAPDQPDLSDVLEGWSDGIVPAEVVAALERRRRFRAETQAKVARRLGVSREHYVNGRMMRFGWSADVVNRAKAYLAA